MNKKQNTMYGIIGLVLGIIGGIAGTAFSMGADRQRVNDLLIQHTTRIVGLDKADAKIANSNKEKTDHLAKVIADQMEKLQLSIAELSHTVGDVRIDIQVIKALMERMEDDLKNKDNR